MTQAALSAAPSARPASPRSRFPFVLTRGTERFEGLNVLEEVDEDVGVLLWRSLRGVLLWARTPARKRAVLFEPSAAENRAADLARLPLDHDLFAPLCVFHALVERPGDVDVPRLVNACRRVMRWAEDRGSLATALDFAQAAALSSPEAAGLAYDVGRLSRRRAEYDRAQSWYTRAVVLARRTGDWRHYALACSGLGNLLVQRGNLRAARKSHLRCLRACVRHGVHEVRPLVLHDLFVIADDMGDVPTAVRYATEAFQAYDPAHPNVPRLAYDVAHLWTLQGLFSCALPVQQALLDRFSGTSERLLVQGEIARAAGGLGKREVFRRAHDAVWETVERGRSMDSAARALVAVAHGASSLDEWDLAERAAARAVEIASDRSEGRFVLVADALLDACRTRRASKQPAQDVDVEPVHAERFAGEIVRSLRSVTATA